MSAGYHMHSISWLVGHANMVRELVEFFRLHAWGEDLKEAFAACAVAMYGYMTDIQTVSENTEQIIEVSGKLLANTATSRESYIITLSLRVIKTVAAVMEAL